MTRPRWKRAIAAGAVTLAFYVGWAVAFPGRAFDAAVWRDDTQVRAGVRLGMADRLIARGTLRGKTRAEVVDLLSGPPPNGYFGSWDMVYWLGLERSYFAIDSEWLVLHLGEDGRVSECRLVTD